MKRRCQGSKDSEYELCLKLEENKEESNRLNQRIRKLEQEVLHLKKEVADNIDLNRLALVNASIQQEEAVRLAVDVIIIEHKSKVEQLGLSISNLKTTKQHNSKYHQKRWLPWNG